MSSLNDFDFDAIFPFNILSHHDRTSLSPIILSNHTCTCTFTSLTLGTPTQYMIHVQSSRVCLAIGDPSWLTRSLHETWRSKWSIILLAHQCVHFWLYPGMALTINDPNHYATISSLKLSSPQLQYPLYYHRMVQTISNLCFASLHSPHYCLSWPQGGCSSVRNRRVCSSAASSFWATGTEFLFKCKGQRELKRITILSPCNL